MNRELLEVLESYHAPFQLKKTKNTRFGDLVEADQNGECSDSRRIKSLGWPWRTIASESRANETLDF